MDYLCVLAACAVAGFAYLAIRASEFLEWHQNCHRPLHWDMQPRLDGYKANDYGPKALGMYDRFSNLHLFIFWLTARRR